MNARTSSGMAPDDIAPLAVTMGEPAGIGGEIILKAWRQGGQPFFCIDDPDRLRRIAADGDRTNYNRVCVVTFHG